MTPRDLIDQEVSGADLRIDPCPGQVQVDLSRVADRFMKSLSSGLAIVGGVLAILGAMNLGVFSGFQSAALGLVVGGSTWLFVRMAYIQLFDLQLHEGAFVAETWLDEKASSANLAEWERASWVAEDILALSARPRLRVEHYEARNRDILEGCRRLHLYAKGKA